MTVDLRSCFLVLTVLSAQLSAAVAVAGETIYEFAGEDGAITLSNVPTNQRYEPLVSDAAGQDNAVGGQRPVVAFKDTKKARFEELVEQTADAVGLDAALLHAVISVESGYDPVARSRKGAIGLMQLMPATAKRYGVADARDPAQNLQGGAKYLRDLLKLFDRDLSLALAAYNAGETAVAKYGNRIPPFRETAEYVPRVLAHYREYQANGHDLE